MTDSTRFVDEVRPARVASRLDEAIGAHALAARLVEDACRLQVALPDSDSARDAMRPLLTQAARVEAVTVAELTAVLDAGLTEAEVERVVAHSDAMYDVRPRLGRFVERLLLRSVLDQRGAPKAA